MKRYHILALLVVLIWGTTFVSTKILIRDGLQPAEIFIIRAAIAYICLWTVSFRNLMARNLKDELLFVVLGVTGASLYFNAENYAVQLTLVNNVSFIVCTAPIFTAILATIFTRDIRATRKLFIGSAVAIVGMGLVIFNGHFILKLNPLGDLLALVASLCWGVYGILIRKPANRYGAGFVTRKIFFYGLLTGIPFLFIGHTPSFPLDILCRTDVILNILYLSVVSSFVCFVVWSLAIKKIGAVQTQNYIYLNPISTVITSALFLSEPMTLIAYLGCALILLGVIVANRQ